MNSGRIEGERGGPEFPFHFSRGNAMPIAQMARDLETEPHWMLWNTEKPTSSTGLSSV